MHAMQCWKWLRTCKSKFRGLNNYSHRSSLVSDVEVERDSLGYKIQISGAGGGRLCTGRFSHFQVEFKL